MPLMFKTFCRRCRRRRRPTARSTGVRNVVSQDAQGGKEARVAAAKLRQEKEQDDDEEEEDEEKGHLRPGVVHHHHEQQKSQQGREGGGGGAERKARQLEGGRGRAVFRRELHPARAGAPVASALMRRSFKLLRCDARCDSSLLGKIKQSRRRRWPKDG
jgi:hypothetical protein